MIVIVVHGYVWLLRLQLMLLRLLFVLVVLRSYLTDSGSIGGRRFHVWRRAILCCVCRQLLLLREEL